MASGYISEIFVSFQGEGMDAGRRHLFVRLAGCPLRCRYCDTPESLERTPRARVDSAVPRCVANPVSAEFAGSLIHEVLQSRGPVDGSAVTGGEPLAQPGFLAALLDQAELPRPVLLETAGVHAAALARIAPRVDQVSMDLKLPSCSGEGEFWEQHARFLRICAEKAYIKIPLGRGFLLDELRRAAELVAAVDPSIPVFLQPVTGRDQRLEVDGESLERAYREARNLLKNVRVSIQQHKVPGLP